MAVLAFPSFLCSKSLHRVLLNGIYSKGTGLSLRRNLCDKKGEKKQEKKAPLVLVHGAFHGEWYWRKVIPFLKQAGREFYCFDLPGHGQDTTPANEITMDKYVDKVCSVLEDFMPTSVTLVGHSLGGIVISEAAERKMESVNKLVYLCALLVKNGESAHESLSHDEDAELLDSLESLEDGLKCKVLDEKVRDIFYNDCTQNDVDFCKNNFQAQVVTPFGFPLAVTKSRFKSIPKVYIECLQDHTISLNHQRRMQKNWACQKMALNTGHFPMISAPEELAKILMQC